jgi:hypothetical protein
LQLGGSPASDGESDADEPAQKKQKLDASGEAKRGRGRQKGSKNNPKSSSST